MWSRKCGLKGGRWQWEFREGDSVSVGMHCDMVSPEYDVLPCGAEESVGGSAITSIRDRGAPKRHWSGQGSAGQGRQAK